MAARDHEVHIHVTYEQRVRWKAEAQKREMSLSTFVRMAVESLLKPVADSAK